MIDKKVLNFNYDQLVYWLRHIAGSSNPDYFIAHQSGGLKLQQIPEEYAELLLFLKEFGASGYLALGVGNGGSFAMECLFMSDTLTNAIAIDNLAYGDLIKQSESEILNFISDVKEHCHTDCNIQFYNMSTNKYFGQLLPQAFFDVGFVDADHSYEGVKADYLNIRKHIRKNGLIIFHDINSASCPGIKRIWKELKHQYRWSKEIIHSETCGIGIIQM